MNLSILNEVDPGIAHQLCGGNLAGKPVVLIRVRGAADPVVHAGQAAAALDARASVLAAAHARNPERFVRGVPRPLTPAAEVWINPPENRPTARTLELPRDTQFVPQVSQSH